MDCHFESFDNKWKCIVCGRIVNKENVRASCKPNKEAIESKPPDLIHKTINFTKSLVKHVAKGRPKATQEQIEQRLSICKECPLFKKNKDNDNGICGHSSCGCNIKDTAVFFNKLAWADQSCPIGKWGPIDEKGV